MKKIILIVWSVCITTLGLHAQVKDTIKDDGFAFSPAELTVTTLDTVVFSGSDFHPVLEVSEATWTNKGTTALPGGFDFPSGSGKIRFSAPGTHFYICTNHIVSHDMKGKIIVTAVTAVPDVSGSDILSIYPVPLTENTLFVHFRNPVQNHVSVFIYDIAGKLRFSSAGATTNGNYEIDCSSLPKGIFLMKLSANGGDTYSKFVRE
jgi:plastocyanin